jgi:hypothetical protein
VAAASLVLSRYSAPQYFVQNPNSIILEGKLYMHTRFFSKDLVMIFGVRLNVTLLVHPSVKEQTSATIAPLVPVSTALGSKIFNCPGCSS